MYPIHNLKERQNPMTASSPLHHSIKLQQVEEKNLNDIHPNTNTINFLPKLNVVPSKLRNLHKTNFCEPWCFSQQTNFWAAFFSKMSKLLKSLNKVLLGEKYLKCLFRLFQPCFFSCLQGESLVSRLSRDGSCADLVVMACFNYPANLAILCCKFIPRRKAKSIQAKDEDEPRKGLHH